MASKRSLSSAFSSPAKPENKSSRTSSSTNNDSTTGRAHFGHLSASSAISGASSGDLSTADVGSVVSPGRRLLGSRKVTNNGDSFSSQPNSYTTSVTTTAALSIIGNTAGAGVGLSKTSSSLLDTEEVRVRLSVSVSMSVFVSVSVSPLPPFNPSLTHSHTNTPPLPP